MENLLVEMGARIYERRRQLRLTQEEIAEQAELTSQTISYAELGKKALRPENIIKLSAVLGVSTDYLLCGEITGVDISFLADKTAKLTPAQYRHLEDIIDSYIAGLNSK